jgi:predicted Zn-dependent protease
MSGLQVDFYSDYIGGEVRLALWHENGSAVPVTGISIAGKLSEVLGGIRFSRTVVTEGSCRGPETALLENMQIF